MGYEIDFLPVGNGNSSGDAIVIRYGEPGSYKIMVVDGGSKDSGQNLVDHIVTYFNTTFVDYVVNTHPDQDHASGLSVVLEKLEVGELWLHRPWNHTKEIIEHFKDGRITEESLARRFKEDGFPYAHALEEIALEKGIPIFEPYQGSAIGDFYVISPHKDWYLHDLIPDFNKTPQKKEATDSILKKFAESVKRVFEDMNIETLKEDVSTSSDNESSTVLYAKLDGHGILLTGDAGIRALNHAYDYAISRDVDISIGLKFVQIPHHGSRHNVSPSILDKILGNKGQSINKVAFVSAGKESKTHPRKVVTNAFIRRGCDVIATQGQSVSQPHNMPGKPGWTTVVPLSFSTEVEE